MTRQINTFLEESLASLWNLPIWAWNRFLNANNRECFNRLAYDSSIRYTNNLQRYIYSITILTWYHISFLHAETEGLLAGSCKLEVKLTTNLHTPAVKRSSSCNPNWSPHRYRVCSLYLGITNSHTIHTRKRRKANWTDHILCGKCRLKHVIEGKRRKDRSD
jgi:hypothetical protein